MPNNVICFFYNKPVKRQNCPYKRLLNEIDMCDCPIHGECPHLALLDEMEKPNKDATINLKGVKNEIPKESLDVCGDCPRLKKAKGKYLCGCKYREKDGDCTFNCKGDIGK